jgi:hypothetical protein
MWKHCLFLSVVACQFGVWNDHQSPLLPSFLWQLDQLNASSPRWRDSRGRSRADHWHVTGNDRFNMLMSDFGSFALFETDHGERWINQLDVARGQLGGGLSYVRDMAVGNVECSAYGLQSASQRANATREIGVGFFRTRSLLLGGRVAIDHRVFVPVGNGSVVLDVVDVTNVGAAALTIQTTEFFDVNQLQLALDWAVAGAVLGNAADDARRLINALFSERAGAVGNDRTIMTATMRRIGLAKSSPASAYIDDRPPTVFAAVVDGWNRSAVAATHADQRVSSATARRLRLRLCLASFNRAALRAAMRLSKTRCSPSRFNLCSWRPDSRFRSRLRLAFATVPTTCGRLSKNCARLELRACGEAVLTDESATSCASTSTHRCRLPQRSNARPCGARTTCCRGPRGEATGIAPP